MHGLELLVGLVVLVRRRLEGVLGRKTDLPARPRGPRGAAALAVAVVSLSGLVAAGVEGRVLRGPEDRRLLPVPVPPAEDPLQHGAGASRLVGSARRVAQRRRLRVRLPAPGAAGAATRRRGGGAGVGGDLVFRQSRPEWAPGEPPEDVQVEHSAELQRQHGTRGSLLQAASPQGAEEPTEVGKVRDWQKRGDPLLGFDSLQAPEVDGHGARDEARKDQERLH
mmetsp:Transcript_112341/g.356995  ORF Transcript_112341/g.356995 Transcript_112341/m.356995 type:complete len:223 (+) Transcript_112341:1454-2122(+)